MTLNQVCLSVWCRPGAVVLGPCHQDTCMEFYARMQNTVMAVESDQASRLLKQTGRDPKLLSSDQPTPFAHAFIGG